MTSLVIDIGNSFIKTGVFNMGGLIYIKRYETLDITIVSELLDQLKPVKAIVSSVKMPGTEPWEIYLSGRIPVIRFNVNMALSIKNHYRTPQTLGLDRLAAVAGAHALYPGIDNLVIDAGTCITYDWADRDGNYFGGSISPGLNMRYKALNFYTSALPLLQADPHFTQPAGDDTTTAIRSGVQNGIRYEVEGFVKSYSKAQIPMNIVLTGGDSIFFDTVLKNSIFAPHIKIEPHLVLSGLNAVIQQHND
jgi:type III pantothenate kinase